jgi:hypothetical protein
LDEFLGKLQRNDQAKDTLSAISRKLKVITLEHFSFVVVLLMDFGSSTIC